MNFLAHAYLSFNDTPILIGNMISDYVKGAKKWEYPPDIAKGIQLHRAIDEFTDNHTATKQAKQYFRASSGLYAGALVDVAYDYFLANDTAQFNTSNDLLAFAKDTYARLGSNAETLPPAFGQMLPYMQSQNWLYNYQYNWGIEKSITGLSKRAKYFDNVQGAYNAFLESKQELQVCYDAFFNELKTFVQQRLELLL